MFIVLTYENQWNFHTKSPAVYSVHLQKTLHEIIHGTRRIFFIHRQYLLKTGGAGFKCIYDSPV